MPTDAKPSAEARIHRSRLIHKGLYGGNSDPNRCVCAQKEKGRYADTPHIHYPEPPYACARCDCEAYEPAEPPSAEAGAPPSPDDRDEEAKLAALRLALIDCLALGEVSHERAAVAVDAFVAAAREQGRRDGVKQACEVLAEHRRHAALRNASIERDELPDFVVLESRGRLGALMDAEDAVRAKLAGEGEPAP